MATGNSRFARVERWLRQSSAGTASLEWREDDEWSVLWEGAVDDTKSVATLVCEVAQDTAEEVGKTLTLRLRAGKQAALPLRAVPAEGGALGVSDLDGSRDSQLVQLQRHLEAMAMTTSKERHALSATLENVLAAQNQVIGRLADRLQQAEETIDQGSPGLELPPEALSLALEALRKLAKR